PKLFLFFGLDLKVSSDVFFELLYPMSSLALGLKRVFDEKGCIRIGSFHCFQTSTIHELNCSGTRRRQILDFRTSTLDRLKTNQCRRFKLGIQNRLEISARNEAE